MALAAVRDRKESLNIAASRLLEQLEQVSAFARMSFEERWDRTESFPEAPARELVRRLVVQDYSTLLRELNSTLMPALVGAEYSRIPIELEQLATRLSTEASGGRPLNVVLFSDDRYNYSIQYYSEPTTYLARRIAPRTTAPPARNEEFLFLRLPRLERDSAMLHAVLIGHEIGHLRDWFSNVSGSINVQPPEVWLDDNGQTRDRYVAAVEFYRDLLTSWSSELVSDAFGALTLGPASLFAITELVSAVGPIDSDSDSHPGTDRRAGFILALLRDRGFGQVEELFPVLDQFKEVTAAAEDRKVVIPGFTDRDPTFDEAAQAAWSLLRVELPRLTSNCVDVLGAAIVDAAIWPQVEHAALQFARGRPFGERITTLADANSAAAAPVPEAVILNGAWLVKLRNLSGLGEVVGLSAELFAEMGELEAVLDGLVLKSIEISDVRRKVPWSHQQL